MVIYPRLSRPEPGQPLKISWGNSVVDAIRSLTPISGKNVRVTRNSNGTVIDVDADVIKRAAMDSGLAPVPCRIEGGDALQGYDVTVFADGLLLPPTGTGTLMVMQFNTETFMPEGTVVMAYPSKNMIIGGSEQE